MKSLIKYYIAVCSLLLLCTGCSGNKIIKSQQDTPEFKNLSPKEQVEIVHSENLKIFLSGDAKTFADAFSTNYLDFFRSQNGKKADVDKTYFEKWFKTKNYEACKKMKFDELVDVAKKQVYSYDEIMKMNPNTVAVNNEVGFKYKEGDILIKFPRKNDSPMINGWNGVYRKENTSWKIVAGNF